MSKKITTYSNEQIEKKYDPVADEAGKKLKALLEKYRVTLDEDSINNLPIKDTELLTLKLQYLIVNNIILAKNDISFKLDDIENWYQTVYTKQVKKLQNFAEKYNITLEDNLDSLSATEIDLYYTKLSPLVKKNKSTNDTLTFSFDKVVSKYNELLNSTIHKLEELAKKHKVDLPKNLKTLSIDDLNTLYNKLNCKHSVKVVIDN